VVTVIDDSEIPDLDTVAVVVYDPTGGFVTGGGWIDSLPGAYVPDELLTGKANFGFVSRLNFHSSSYEWLVVNQAGTRAQFKGSGTINGDGVYKFMLRAGDGDPDTFWIQIWEEIDDKEMVIYDNGSDQSVAGGSIIVRKGDK